MVASVNVQEVNDGSKNRKNYNYEYNKTSDEEELDNDTNDDTYPNEQLPYSWAPCIF